MNETMERDGGTRPRARGPAGNYGTRPRVMVVDDDADVAAGILDTLEDEGFRVQAFPDGTNALNHFLAERQDVVVSDIRMPGLDGFGLLENIRRESPATPVVLISAYGDWESWSRAIELGAVDLIQKPCSTGFILEVVQRVLKKI